MKIYAKQVPPEYQESPLFLFNEWPEDMAIYGNRDYNEHCPDIFNRVFNALYNGELLEVWDNMQNFGGDPYYSNWADALNDFVAPENREPYTREERKHWPHVLLQYCDARLGSFEEDQALCEALELVTGKAWSTGTISGCSQGDWQKICYISENWTREALDALESEYFNTGTEWIIHDENTEPETPEDVSGYSVYCYRWNNDQIRAEIADAAGGSPENVILYEFSGYTRSAIYTEV